MCTPQVPFLLEPWLELTATPPASTPPPPAAPVSGTEVPYDPSTFVSHTSAVGSVRPRVRDKLGAQEPASVRLLSAAQPFPPPRLLMRAQLLAVQLPLICVHHRL